ncbi:flagellar basal body rod C-terminal domain-containing protein [Nocardioides sp.]|uniref:flagellar basal body rod protein FlgC n=1 Tax=Nocardioides sp. TaxID=35761 RepID=UPI002603A313|nr:flagellar basal body rod C-terminal domain-containing protein [Nocardioides sp.]
MGAFDMLSIANTGMGAHQTWLDALAGNIANVNTIKPTSEAAVTAKFPVFTADANGGVDVAGFAQSSTEGIVVNSPDSPLADANGNVRAPSIDMASQMSQLIMAQRGYQGSVQVTKSAQDTYDSALSIGAK